MAGTYGTHERHTRRRVPTFESARVEIEGFVGRSQGYVPTLCNDETGDIAQNSSKVKP